MDKLLSIINKWWTEEKVDPDAERLKLREKAKKEIDEMNADSEEEHYEFNDDELLVKFISPQGKILSRRATGLTAKQQRVMANAIKRARMGGLLPFVNYEVAGKNSF